MDTLLEGSLCDFAEDVCGVRRRRVSMSSVDSEPILKRRRLNAAQPARTRQRSVGADDERGDSDCGAQTAGASDWECCSSFLDEDDDVDATAEGRSAADSVTHHEALLPAETHAALYDASGEPLVNIPIERVSGGMVATVTATIARENTVIADNAAGALVMDAGTRLCLADGSVVGVIAAVMGPVSSCAYAVVCLPAVFDALRACGRLTPGADLCYDLGEQHIIHDPATQCDTRRGTDASYINDEELPPHARPDFSDDEVERQWKMAHRTDAGVGQMSSDDEPADIDWDKISALEECLRDGVEERSGAGGVTEHVRCRLVVPPWVAALSAHISEGDEGKGEFKGFLA